MWFRLLQREREEMGLKEDSGGRRVSCWVDLCLGEEMGFNYTPYPLVQNQKKRVVCVFLIIRTWCAQRHNHRKIKWILRQKISASPIHLTYTSTPCYICYCHCTTIRPHNVSTKGKESAYSGQQQLMYIPKLEQWNYENCLIYKPWFGNWSSPFNNRYRGLIHGIWVVELWPKIRVQHALHSWCRLFW